MSAGAVLAFLRALSLALSCLALALMAAVAAFSSLSAIDRFSCRTRLDRLTIQPSGPIGRTDERTAHHPGVPGRQCLLPELDELLGLHPTVDGVVPGGGPEVLGDGQDLRARLVQVANRRGDLLPGLPHPEDEVRLGHQPGLAGPAQHLQRAVVAEAGADPLEDP